MCCLGEVTRNRGASDLEAQEAWDWSEPSVWSSLSQKRWTDKNPATLVLREGRMMECIHAALLSLKYLTRAGTLQCPLTSTISELSCPNLRVVSFAKLFHLEGKSAKMKPAAPELCCWTENWETLAAG